MRAPRADFDWVVGAPRNRYIRYKSLTSSRQEGIVKFTRKEWAGLPDGEYLFSIDTGSVECGAAGTTTYCVSQRLKIVSEAVVATIGQAHGSPLPPATINARARAGGMDLTSGGGVEEAVGDDGDDDDDVIGIGVPSAQLQYMFAVPLFEFGESLSSESADVKRVYTMVDRLSYLDWGLRTEDEVSGKRAASLASNAYTDWNGCIVHNGAKWGEAAHGVASSSKGPKTAVTSEGYGEATVATAEKMLRLLAKLTSYVPAMRDWAGPWNLDADSTFLDIGSGYGKVCALACARALVPA